MNYIKIFSLFLAVSISSSCVMHVRETKYEKKYTLDEMINENEKTKEVASFINFNYFNKKNIIKTFGEPVNIEKNGDIETLYYATAGKAPESMLGLVILPIPYQNGDEIYRYSFNLKSNKLNGLAYENLKKHVFAIGLLPLYYNKTYYSELDPYTDYKCDDKFAKIYGTFPNMISGESRIKKNCYNNKLFGIKSIHSQATDHSRGKEGYTKVVNSKVFLYDKNIFKASRQDLEKRYRKDFENLELDRLTEHTPIKERAFSNKYLDCKILSRKAKDYKAPNKGSNQYLIMDVSGALCYSKVNNMVIDMQTSNRYPEYMGNNIQTLVELMEILNTIKID